MLEKYTILKKRHSSSYSPGDSCKWLLLVAVTSFALCIPFIRFVPFLGDEGVLLHGAVRMLRGETIYVDFFEFLPPGGFIITAGWFKIFGISMWSSRLLVILTICAIACFTYLCSLRVSESPKISACIAIAWVVTSQGLLTQVSHHWFTTLFSMMSFWASLVFISAPNNSRYYSLASGVFVGVAAMITPTRGVLALLAGATAIHGVRSHKHIWILYFSGIMFVPTCLLINIIYQGSFSEAFANVIVWTATQYSSIQGVPFGFPFTPGYPIRFLFPFTAVLALSSIVFCWRTLIDDQLFKLCIAFGLAGFIGCFPRPDIAHIAFAAPLICPLLANCVARIKRLLHPNIGAATVGFLIIICIPFVHGYWLYTDYALNVKTLDTPRGQVAAIENHVELMARISITPTNEKYFFYPYMPLLPFITAREHVSKYDMFMPNYTTPTQYQEACMSALQDATWVVIDKNWTDLAFLKKVFPSINGTMPQEVLLFERVLNNNFKLVESIGSFEVRRRLVATDQRNCFGIAELTD